MITNRKLTLFIFLTSIILVFINYPISSSAGIRMMLHWDLLSFVLVGINSFLWLFLITNNINYENAHYLKIRSQFLIEIFILSGVLTSLFSLNIMTTYASISDDEITGEIIARIGLSFGVSFIALLYSFLFATSTYLITKLILSKNNEKNKLFNIQHPKKWVSLICFSFIIILKYGEFWIGFDMAGLNFKNSFKTVYLLNTLILVLIFSIIINNKIKIILNSFLNKIQSFELLEQALTANTSLIKVISGLNTIILLSTIIHIMFVQGIDGANIWTTFSTATFILLINFTFILVSKVIELRLRTDLIGQNHFHSKVDKYFLFKYILPVLMVYMIVLIFQFIITFFI